MRAIDADALYKDICDSLNEMTRIGIAVDGEWLWGKLNDSLENAPTINSEPHWIPCSERLPEDEDVLIQFPSNMAVGRYCGEWRINSGGNWETEICMDDEKPIAWMPLPECYREGD